MNNEHRFDLRTKPPQYTDEWRFCLTHQRYERGLEQRPQTEKKSNITEFLRRLASGIGLEICTNPKCVTSFPYEVLPHEHDILEAL